MINYNGITLGKILDEDALLLQAIIKMTSPKTLVEFGFLHGDSAKKMLEVMDNEAHLYSFDNTTNGKDLGSNFTFHKLSQTEIDKTDIKDIDFVFIDASHEIELNKETFKKLLPLLTEKAIIIIHDTGSWCDGNVWELERGRLNPDGSWTHCPDEVDFVNWIKENYPEWQQIHLHSKRQLRHGMTLLQKYVKIN